MTQTYHDMAIEIAEDMRSDVLEKYRNDHSENPATDMELPYYTLVVLPEVENYGIDARIEKLNPLLCEAYGNVHQGTKATVARTDIIRRPFESPNIYLAIILYVEAADAG